MRYLNQFRAFRVNISAVVTPCLSVLLITVFLFGSISCRKQSIKEKIIGTWAFQEGWSLDKNGDAVFPAKTNPKYQLINRIYREGMFKDDYIFFSMTDEGLVSKNGVDSSRIFPYQFINDSTFKWNYIKSIVRFEDDNHLLLIQREDSDLIKQGASLGDVMRFERVKIKKKE